MQDIGQRKSQLLRLVVEEYIRDACPVGSRTLSRRSGLGLSAATIRNEMSDLEELGLLEQPHPSAGRVPTDSGYRFYVDHLMEPQALGEDVLDEVRRLFLQQVSAIEVLAGRLATALAAMCRYLVVVSGPQWGDARLRHLNIGMLEPGRGLLVVVSDLGFVEHAVVELPPDISPRQLEQLSRRLTAALAGVPWDRLSVTMARQVASDLAVYREVLEQTVAALRSALRADGGHRLYVGGTAGLLGHPEFHESRRAQQLLELVEREGSLGLPSDQSGVGLWIGQENSGEALKNCSVAAATLPVGVQVAMIGPTRMEYATVLSLLQTVLDVGAAAWQRRL